MPTAILDDRDPSIVYSSGWYQGGSSNEYDSTTMFTRNAGATATVNFQGSGIAVYGTIGSSNLDRSAPQSSYQIDGSKVGSFDPTLEPTPLYHQLFFQSTQLPMGQHTLVVTNLLDGSDPLLIDYILVTTANNTPSPPTVTAIMTSIITTGSPSSSVSPPETRPEGKTAPTTSTSFTTTGGQTTLSSPLVAIGSNIPSTILSSLSAAPTVTVYSTSSPNHLPPSVAVAGGVAGAVAGIFLIIGISYFHIRRRRRKPISDADVVSSYPFKMLTLNPNRDDVNERPQSHTTVAREDASHNQDSNASPPAYLP